MTQSIVILLLAAFFRVHLLGVDVRFHPDEALFASFARNAAVRGEWLLPGNLDKTPLSIYGQAASMLLFGIEWDGAVWRLDARQGEFAARLWSLYASVLLVAVTMAVTRRIRANHWIAPAIAGGLVALSPYPIAFSATAFTDTPMVLFGMLAVWFALRGRGTWAGMWLVLAYASKQQGVLFAPLVVGLLWLRGDSPLRVFAGFATAVGVGAAALALWDAARPFPSVLLLATQNNAPDVWLVPPRALIARAAAWLDLGRWLFGGAWLTLAVVALAVWGAVRRAAPTTLVFGFVVGYGLLHWLVPLNVYDRYWLPLVPLLAILAGVGVQTLPRRTPYRVSLLILLAMLPGAWRAANGALPIGGDRGEHDSVIALADYLNRREFGAIVYDRWLGWELNYYLGGWTDKRRAYYPTPQQMTTDPELYAPDVAPRYFPAPRAANVMPWLDALARAGFEACVGYESENFVVYLLSRPRVDGETSANALARAACRHPVRR